MMYFSNILILAFFSISFTNGFNFPIKSRYFEKPNCKIIEPVKNDLLNPLSNKRINDVIFLSGGGNVIPKEIYSNFINNLASSNFRIFTTDFSKLEEFVDIIKFINSDEVSIILHSSSTKLAFDICNKFNCVNKIIMMDPVDSRFTYNDLFLNLFNKPNKINIDVDDVIIINAGKSYKGSWKPFSLPFIPVLSLNKNNIIMKKEKEIKTITFDDNGHSDILDKPWGDIMHKSGITLGTEKRKYNEINNYHQNIIDIIVNFLIKG